MEVPARTAQGPRAGAPGPAAARGCPDRITIPEEDAGDAGHLTRCDDGGHCSCINVASVGHEGVWGPNCVMGDTAAFFDWLNTQSTAKVDVCDQAKPTITADFVAKYDVLILQWMVTIGMQNNDGAAWTFTAAELSAFQTWVNNGGGLIVLAGYQCPANGCMIYDTIAPNQVLQAVTGGDMLFNNDDVLDPAMLQPQPDGYCWGNSLPLWDPLPEGGSPTVGTWNQSTAIGAHVHDIGAYVARSIKVGSPNVTVDANDSTHAFAAHESIGKGHVVVYGDEWATYTGEWYNVAPDGGTNRCQDVGMNCSTRRDSTTHAAHAYRSRSSRSRSFGTTRLSTRRRRCSASRSGLHREAKSSFSCSRR
jgi:hypothetical protein